MQPLALALAPTAEVLKGHVLSVLITMLNDAEVLTARAVQQTKQVAGEQAVY